MFIDKLECPIFSLQLWVNIKYFNNKIMAENEPVIPPVNGDGIVDDDTTKTPDKGDPTANKDGGDGKEKDGVSPDEPTEREKQLMEGWKEDREYYQGEIKRLRTEANHPTFTKAEQDELAGIDDPDERAEKKFEFKQKRKEEADQAEIEAVKSEVRYMKRTSKEFADNEKEILKTASDYECKTLSQAILIWRGLNISKIQKNKEIDDKRKKGADGKGGGNAAGKPAAGTPYDPKTDGKKSISQLYSEGLSK